jgi:predicted phosphodiesterase
VPQLRESQIDLLFVAGDFVQHGHKLREWQTEWFSPLSIDAFGQTTPIMMARGNHDANGALAHAYAPLPGNGHWHAFSRNGVRFIVLDTESDTDRTPAQLRWLADELASDASRYAELRVVTFHKPPFSNRWHSSKSTYNGEAWVRLHLVPLFEQHKVDLVVAGHAHAYQRRDEGGVRYVVVGGAGGALDRYKTGRWPMTVDYVGHHYAVMEVSDRRLSWVARDFSGEVIDSFELVSRTRHLGK